MLKHTTRSLNTMLEQFCVEPMSASQIHGFLLGLMAGPEEVKENVWLSELFFRDTEGAKSMPSFDSFPRLREYVKTCETGFNEAYEEITTGEPAAGYGLENEDPDEELLATARELAGGFLRGFRLAGGMEDESRLDEAAVRAFSVLYALSNPEKTAEILSESETPEDLSEYRLTNLLQAAMLKLAFVMHGGDGSDNAESE